MCLKINIVIPVQPSLEQWYPVPLNIDLELEKVQVGYKLYVSCANWSITNLNSKFMPWKRQKRNYQEANRCNATANRKLATNSCCLPCHRLPQHTWMFSLFFLQNHYQGRQSRPLYHIFSGKKTDAMSPSLSMLQQFFNLQFVELHINNPIGPHGYMIFSLSNYMQIITVTIL